MDGLITGAGRAAGWLAKAGWNVTKKLPGGDIADRQLKRLEYAVVDEVRKRLDYPGNALASPERTAGWRRQAIEGEVTDSGNGSPAQLVEPLRAAMAELLSASVTYGREASRDYLFAAVLRQVVPDEARILAATADGTVYPLVHLVTRGPLGGTRRTLLENFSSVAREAGVALVDQGPVYVGRLVRFGLLDIGGENTAQAGYYDMLLADSRIRGIIDGGKRVQVQRRTLGISAFGAELWEACDPSKLGQPELDRP
ncbi:uncharacterized protein DUF4393 [Herbihabitans rhizosphaerae]|uniref:Uncharacterized protein DUF4393 n=1 Tax=Herbihabitans rhizosphaerae TaxID=1872711 RepID=A0A4Q7L688_9PSEU|nr:uncharacterized protein DUF4393 [Herbihabitans rhizosphaerae]